MNESELTHLKMSSQLEQALLELETVKKEKEILESRIQTLQQVFYL
jgi:hypothetical protein